MNIEWLVTNVTAVGSPDRAERAVLGLILARCFFANSGCIYSRGATLSCRNPPLSSNNFTQGWLVTDITAVGSLDRAEHAILGVILAEFFFTKLGHF